MATATTSAVWRSTGGDQTRTAQAGSMVMVTPFYIANAAATANVVTSSASGAPAVVLPAGAVVTEILITTDNATGETDFGFTPVGGSNTPAGLADNATNARGVINMNSATAGASLGLVMSSTALVNITARAGGTAGTGNIAGTIIYYVTDPYVGQQNV